MEANVCFACGRAGATSAIEAPAHALLRRPNLRDLEEALEMLVNQLSVSRENMNILPRL